MLLNQLYVVGWVTPLMPLITDHHLNQFWPNHSYIIAAPRDWSKNIIYSSSYHYLSTLVDTSWNPSKLNTIIYWSFFINYHGCRCLQNSRSKCIGIHGIGLWLSCITPDSGTEWLLLVMIFGNIFICSFMNTAGLRYDTRKCNSEIYVYICMFIRPI